MAVGQGKESEVVGTSGGRGGVHVELAAMEQVAAKVRHEPLRDPTPVEAMHMVRLEC